VTEQPWPEDIAFRTFAAKLADAVMLRLSQDWVITTQYERAFLSKSCCPLACLGRPELDTFPTHVRGLGEEQLNGFLAGFDGGHTYEGDPFNRLGRAYRERFVK